MDIIPALRPSKSAWVLTVFSDEKLERHPFWMRLSTVNKKHIAAIAKRGDFGGRLGQIRMVDCPGTRPGEVFLVGLGKKTEYHQRRMVRMMQQLTKYAKEQHREELSVAPLTMKVGPWEAEKTVEALGVAAAMADYVFTKYRKKAHNGITPIKKLEFVLDAAHLPAARAAISRAKIIAAAVNESRDLANTPGGTMTPTLLVASAKKLLKDLPLTVTVLGEKEMRRLGMGGILGVSSGSREEAQFLIMEYLPLKKTRPLVFVGKGVTFDSGGLNLKPSEWLNDMHHDMAGAGAVITAMSAIARLKIQRNIVGITPITENMPGGAGYRPGDVLTMLSGTTVEIGNTDAEGRIILADALTYAKRYAPTLVVDIATLTGAAIVALGRRIIAGLSPNDGLALALREFSEPSGDYVWPLPLWEEHTEDIRGTFADINNAGRTKGAGGVSIAAAFLKEFTQGYEWMHLDIASTMVAAEGMPLAPGATGTGVRFLIDVARRFEELQPYLKK